MQFKRFNFNYQIDWTSSKGDKITIDRATVGAIAYLYGDGTVRSADVEYVWDMGGNEVSRWIPFLDYKSPANQGDWMKELEIAAKFRAQQLFEEAIRN